MKTIICKHDDCGNFEVIGTNGESMRLILLEDDYCGEANINVNGSEMVGWEFTVNQDAELIENALSSYKKIEEVE